MTIHGKHMRWADEILIHATQHYNDRGIRWDYVVECWTREEIAAHFDEFPPEHYVDALESFRSYAETMDEREKAANF